MRIDNHHIDRWQADLISLIHVKRFEPNVSSPDSLTVDRWTKKLRQILGGLLILHWCVGIMHFFTYIEAMSPNAVIFISIVAHQYIYISRAGVPKQQRRLALRGWKITQWLLKHVNLRKPTYLEVRTLETLKIPLRIELDHDTATLSWAAEKPVIADTEETPVGIIDDPLPIIDAALKLDRGQLAAELFSNFARDQIILELRSTIRRDHNIALKIDEDHFEEAGLLLKALPVMEFDHPLSLNHQHQASLMASLHHWGDLTGTLFNVQGDR